MAAWLVDAALGVLAAAGPASVACESRSAVLVAVAGFFPMSRSFAVCGSLSSAGRTRKGPQYSFPRKTIYHKFTTDYKTLWGRSTKCQGPARFPCNRMNGGTRASLLAVSRRQAPDSDTWCYVPKVSENVLERKRKGARRTVVLRAPQRARNRVGYALLPLPSSSAGSGASGSGWAMPTVPPAVHEIGAVSYTSGTNRRAGAEV